LEEVAEFATMFIYKLSLIHESFQGEPRMVSIIKTCLVSIALFSAPAFSSTYKLDESHTNIGFKIKNLGIATVKGKFNKFEGSGTFDPKTKQINKLAVKIQATSIDTNEADRDKHLRSNEFFDVKKFPLLTFESTKVEYKAKIAKKIHGKLTIHGVTKAIVLDVEWGGVATDPWGNEKLAFEAEAIIDRTDFGLTWNKGLKKAAGLFVANEVKLDLQIQATKMD
jgi:polyisoprenoid-binding protein YceI